MTDKNMEMARAVAEAVRREGGHTYYVGGCVRDRLLGRDNKDIDIEVHGIPVETLERILDSLGERLEMGASFGIMGLRHYELDIAMPRSETATGRGHKDFAVFVDPFLGAEKAARRRAFTMNALLQDVLSVPGSKMAASGVASVRSKVANLKDYLPAFKDVLALKDALHGILAGADGEVILTDSQQAEIERMAEEKFRTWDWLYGRSPEAQFHALKKFACGTVEVNWSVRHGLLEDVRFSGDFIGNLPAERLASCLDGLRYDKEVILAALKEAGVRDYFDGLDAKDLAGLL